MTVLAGVPTTLSVLAKNPPQGENISSLRPYMPTGSTGMPIEVSHEIERITDKAAARYVKLQFRTKELELWPEMPADDTAKQDAAAA